MTYGWSDCPEAVRGQVESLTKCLRTPLGRSLVGIYLHGSLAMGCFNPRRSDLDLLAVVSLSVERSARRGLPAALLEASGRPAPVELSILLRDDLRPWRHPAAYQLHFSESWRERAVRFLANPGAAGSAEETGPLERGGTDPDLSAHVTVLNTRGLRLLGLPIREVFPPVPLSEYRVSILDDVEWGLRRIHDDPVYAVLNCCRVLAFLAEGSVLSKGEAGRWGIGHLPEELQPLARAALGGYEGDDDVRTDPDLLRRFSEFIGTRSGMNVTS
jgi:predicted nucleotidyltransferase